MGKHSMLAQHQESNNNANNKDEVKFPNDKYLIDELVK